jgi:hypothetical protein
MNRTIGDYEPDHGNFGAEDEDGFQAAVPSYSHSSGNSDEDADAGLDWEQREGIRAWYALTSPASFNTDIWNAAVLSRNAIQFRILRDYTRKGEVAPKLTLLLNAINILIARNFTGGSLHWTFRILIAEVLPHCEASKTQLRILQKLFQDAFDSITSFFLAMQLAQSSLNTLLTVPALAANNGNNPYLDPLPF